MSEIRQRMGNSRSIKKEKVEIFSKRVDKAWKNIDEIKSNKKI